MTEDVPKRRRRSDVQSSLSWEGMFSEAASEAKRLPPGSAGAVHEAQKALFYAMQAVHPALDTLVQPYSDDVAAAPIDGAHRRNELMEVLSFLSGAMMFPGWIDRLLLGLHELDRGVTLPELQPTEGGRRGGLSDTQRMRLMQFAVEAADELRQRYQKRVAFDAVLRDECGTSRRTIEGYAEKLKDSPSMKPRRSFLVEAV